MVTINLMGQSSPMTLQRQSGVSPHRGFSLIELLVVMVIIGIVAALSLPAVSSVSRGFNITSGGQMVVDQIGLARQTALAKNRNAEVRFYKKKGVSGSDVNVIGMQVWSQASRNGAIVYEPASRVSWLPTGVKILESDTYSPLIGTKFSSERGFLDLPAGAESYVAVRFRATGNPEAALNFETNFITLVSEQEQGSTRPLNYFTVQIDPLTGRTAIYRPDA